MGLLRLSVALLKQPCEVSTEPFEKAVEIQHFVAADGCHLFKDGPFLVIRFGRGLNFLCIFGLDGGHNQPLQATMAASHRSQPYIATVIVDVHILRVIAAPAAAALRMSHHIPDEQ